MHLTAASVVCHCSHGVTLHDTPLCMHRQVRETSPSLSDAVLDAQIQELVASLPTSLVSLQLSDVDYIAVCATSHRTSPAAPRLESCGTWSRTCASGSVMPDGSDLCANVCVFNILGAVSGRHQRLPAAPRGCNLIMCRSYSIHPCNAMSRLCRDAASGACPSCASCALTRSSQKAMNWACEWIWLGCHRAWSLLRWGSPLHRSALLRNDVRRAQTRFRQLWPVLVPAGRHARIVHAFGLSCTGCDAGRWWSWTQTTSWSSRQRRSRQDLCCASKPSLSRWTRSRSPSGTVRQVPVAVTCVGLASL